MEGISEVVGLQQHYPQFGDMEIRAGRHLLEMLKFESQLSGSLTPQGQPRLSDEILSLCHDICSSSDSNLRKILQKRLLKLACSQERFEFYIRWYKWSKVYCTWKYPEIVGRNNTIISSQPFDDESSFFGLIPADARASKYIIRSLHQDIDCVLGDAPASIQAALGLLND